MDATRKKISRPVLKDNFPVLPSNGAFCHDRFVFVISCSKIVVWIGDWSNTRTATSSSTISHPSAQNRSTQTRSFTSSCTNWFTFLGKCFSFRADSSSSRRAMEIFAKTNRDYCDPRRQRYTTWRHCRNRVCPSPTSDPPGSFLSSTWDHSRTLIIRNFFRYFNKTQFFFFN